MRKWHTQVHAKNAMTGEMQIFDGPYIEAPTQELAQQWCNNNYLGYVRVTPTWVLAEVDEKTGIETKLDHPEN